MVERDPQELLAEYRSALGPSRAVEDRMLASLHAQITAVPDPSGGGAAGGGAGAPTVLSLHARGTGLIKLATLVLIGTVGVAAVMAMIGSDPTPATRTPVAEIEPQRVEPAEPPSASAEPSSSQLEATLPAESELPTEPTPQAPTPARRRARVGEPTPTPTPSLAEEAKLLRSVDAAVRERDFASAHAQLDAYRHTFATGSLRAQADELALLLACAEDPAAASKRASDHLQAHPGSRARGRIEAACGLR